MPIVNYVREHVRFMEYATDEHLTTSERLLWYALMHIMNQRAKGNDWPGEFIRISNDRLLSFCPMKYDTIAAARNSLKQRGLIDYQKGDKNKLSPAYRMFYFFPNECYTEISDNAGDKAGFYPEKSDNMGGNIGDNMGGNIGDIYINNKRQKTFNPNQKDWDREEDEDEDEDGLAHTQAHAREVAATAWRAYLGRDATPTALNAIAWRAVANGFDDDVIRRAVEIAAFKGAASPIDYIVTMFHDWSAYRIQTLDDLEQYQYLREAHNGKLPLCASPDDTLHALEEFRQRGNAQ